MHSQTHSVIDSFFVSLLLLKRDDCTGTVLYGYVYHYTPILSCSNFYFSNTALYCLQHFASLENFFCSDIFRALLHGSDFLQHGRLVQCLQTRRQFFNPSPATFYHHSWIRHKNSWAAPLEAHCCPEALNITIFLCCTVERQLKWAFSIWESSFESFLKWAGWTYPLK